MQPKILITDVEVVRERPSDVLESVRWVYLRDANLDGAQYSKSTLWPQGFGPEAAGAVSVEDND